MLPCVRLLADCIIAIITENARNNTHKKTGREITKYRRYGNKYGADI
jgi:hypothetical protein